MGLTNKKEEQLKKQPIIESRMFRSEDGNFFVTKTVITEIKPISYVEKVLTGEKTEEALA